MGATDPANANADSLRAAILSGYMKEQLLHWFEGVCVEGNHRKREVERERGREREIESCVRLGLIKRPHALYWR